MEKLSTDVCQYIFGYAIGCVADWCRIRMLSKLFQRMVDGKESLKNMITAVGYDGGEIHPDVVALNPEYFQNIITNCYLSWVTIGKYKHMKSLRVSDVSLYLFHRVETLANMHHLTVLDISWTDVTIISTLPPNLKTLVARGVKPLTIDVVSESLTMLDISDSAVISDITCGRSFPNLEVLIANNTTYVRGNVCGNQFGQKINTIYAHGTSVTDDIIENICSTKSLSALLIGVCALTNSNIMMLSKCVQLDTLWFGYDEVVNRGCLQYFHNNVTLSTMYLDNRKYINMGDVFAYSELCNVAVHLMDTYYVIRDATKRGSVRVHE